MIDSIETDLKTALRSGDKDKVLVLKGVKSSLINERIKLGHDLDEEEAAKVLKSEAKQRQEAADIYRSGGAQDKADKELAEKTIIEVYLPQMMSEEEVSKIV
ncbi:MAG TPA: GatB/YqeY domain-containing protein, partial [Candidatus Saccharimonadales bacterium]